MRALKHQVRFLNGAFLGFEVPFHLTALLLGFKGEVLGGHTNALAFWIAGGHECDTGIIIDIDCDRFMGLGFNDNEHIKTPVAGGMDAAAFITVGNMGEGSEKLVLILLHNAPHGFGVGERFPGWAHGNMLSSRTGRTL